MQNQCCPILDSKLRFILVNQIIVSQIRECHLLTIPQSVNDFYQWLGRSNRQGSHKKLDAEDQDLEYFYALQKSCSCTATTTYFHHLQCIFTDEKLPSAQITHSNRATDRGQSRLVLLSHQSKYLPNHVDIMQWRGSGRSGCKKKNIFAQHNPLYVATFPRDWKPSTLSVKKRTFLRSAFTGAIRDKTGKAERNLLKNVNKLDICIANVVSGPGKTRFVMLIFDHAKIRIA